MGRSIFGISFWLVCYLATTICGQQHPVVHTIGGSGKFGGGAVAGKNLIIDSRGGALFQSIGTSDAENVRFSAARSSAAGETKQVSSNLNGVTSSKQVAKSTPPPSKVQFINRFDPYDDATTTINPKLVTLKPGTVQTTEKPVYADEIQGFSEPTTTTTAAPVTTTTNYRPFTTTTYRPEINTIRPVAFSPALWSVSSTKKPFDIFDFYRQLYSPTPPPPLTNTLRPFLFQNAFKAPPAAHNAQHHQFVPESKRDPQPVRNIFANFEPALKTEYKPVIHKKVPEINLITSPESPPNLSQRFSAKEDEKPVPVVFAAQGNQLQSLETNVAPPLSDASQQKPKFNPKVNVQLGDSGHKFINRFVVDEDAIRDEGTIPARSKLDNDVVAPPVKNIRPILSPKISVHVGETGHKFINRFVLTEDEKTGKSASQSFLKGRVAEGSIQNTVEPQIRPGQTAFTSRFEVDDVNKKLFQTVSIEQTVRAPPNHVFFNNRYDEGVNNFNVRGFPEGRSAFGRTIDKTPLFDRFSSRLPSFDHFKKTN